MFIMFVFIIVLLAAHASCGIIRQEEITLTGNERISKRSLPEHMQEVSNSASQRHTRSLLKEQLTNLVEFGDLDTSVNTVAFRPYHRRRVARATEDLLQNTEDGDNLETAANTHVFRPLENWNRYIPKRFRRSIEDNKNHVIEDTGVAVNTIVFIPLFRYISRSANRGSY